jgi:hypothetical protein
VAKFDTVGVKSLRDFLIFCGRNQSDAHGRQA